MSCTCDSHASIARGPRGTCVRVCFALRTTTDYIIIFIRPFNSVSSPVYACMPAVFNAMARKGLRLLMLRPVNQCHT